MSKLKKCSKNSVQYKRQEMIKKNLIYLVDNFDKYKDHIKRSNHLMCISISCRSGSMVFHFGDDPVHNEIVKVKRQRRQKKNEK